jgi:uncharacterized protein YceK
MAVQYVQLAEAGMKGVGAGLVIVAGVLLSGCATVINGQSQKISVSTPPTTDATCTLTNSRGSWQVTSPGTVEVLRSQSNLEAICKKDGWIDGKGINRPIGTRAGTIDVFGFGLLGLAVNSATGSDNEYLANFAIDMSPAPVPTASTAPTAASAAAPGQTPETN